MLSTTDYGYLRVNSVQFVTQATSAVRTKFPTLCCVQGKLQIILRRLILFTIKPISKSSVHGIGFLTQKVITKSFPFSQLLSQNFR